MTHDLAASGLRFGIEEEFFLLDASDLDIVRSAPAGFVAACRDTLGEHFAEEMFECQVEVASPVFSTLAEAARFHGQARQRLAHLAMDFGLRSLCVGTHPFADWRRARSNPAAHFARLFEDQGRVARRSLVCGLHVHVEIPPSHDRMAVLQRVLPWLPLLLALSASSPFRGGRRSGLASYRRALCGEWPRMNIPPALPDEDAYRRHLALLRETGCIREDGQVWWMIRPSSHVPTLELRICDACPRLADALSLAGLAGEALIGLSTADPLFARLEDYLSAVEPPPQVKIAVQTYALARALVEAGAGLALVDPFTALGADPHSTAIRPLSPAFPVTLYAITRADETPPHTLAPLLRMLTRQAEERLRAVQM